MKIEFHRIFRKRYRKVPFKVARQFDERLRIFEANPFHPLLKNHPLSGDSKGQWSINVTGDYRALYVLRGEHTVIFIAIDTHGNLYR